MTQDIFTAIRQGRSIWIGDGGSTKAHWMAFCGGKVVCQIVTRGFNPHQCNVAYIDECLNEAFAYLTESSVAIPERIGYFGAGCGSDAMCGVVKERLGINQYTTGTSAGMEVGSDMVLACKAVAGTSRCMMIILGTGSNSVVWDGKGIVAQIPPLGYLLGDEGSGASIGKRILADVIRGKAPRSIALEVLAGRSAAHLQAEVYQSPTPAAMMADVVKTACRVSGDAEIQYIDTIARIALREFFEKVVDTYQRDSYCGNLCFTGSVAVMFRHILVELASERNLRIKTTVQRPLEAFIDSLEK